MLASQTEEEGSENGYVDKRTPAQMAFDKVQEKRVFMLFFKFISMMFL